jgi:hypothetical protein
LGLQWNLSDKTVEVTKEKKAKYKSAIEEWLSHPIHNLDDVQKLYGKLLHASLVATAGHAYLTNLEVMLGILNTNSFVSHHLPCGTSEDLQWWLNVFSSEKLSRRILVHATSQTMAHSLMPALGLASPSSSVIVGEPGDYSWARITKERIFGGLKQLVLNSSSILSSQLANLASSSGSLATTRVSLKDGGREEVVTSRLTESSGKSMMSFLLTNALLSHAMLQARKTQQMPLEGASTHLLLSTSLLSQS